MTVTIAPNPRLNDRLRRELAAQMLQGGRLAAQETRAEHAAAEGSGAVRGRHKRASAAGEVPVLQSGELYDSIESTPPFERVGVRAGTPGRWTLVRFGSTHLKSKFLEFGTRYMAPRPLLAVVGARLRRAGARVVLRRPLNQARRGQGGAS
ncbi:MAG: hypothetical protein AAFY08_15105 [Planctomycetota bacterium]